MVAAKQNQKFPFHFLSVSYRNCTLFTSDYRCSGSCGNVPHFLTPHTLFPFATLRILAKKRILKLGCGTWTRTRIPCSRGMCPTIRRSRNCYSYFLKLIKFLKLSTSCFLLNLIASSLLSGWKP